MARPDWIKEKDRIRRYKMCITCVHKGSPCGYTNNLGNGRMVMYRCRLHPSEKFYQNTIACQDYKQAR